MPDAAASLPLSRLLPCLPPQAHHELHRHWLGALVRGSLSWNGRPNCRPPVLPLPCGGQLRRLMELTLFPCAALQTCILSRWASSRCGPAWAGRVGRGRSPVHVHIPRLSTPHAASPLQGANVTVGKFIYANLIPATIGERCLSFAAPHHAPPAPQGSTQHTASPPPLQATGLAAPSLLAC